MQEDRERLRSELASAHSAHESLTAQCAKKDDQLTQLRQDCSDLSAQVNTLEGSNWKLQRQVGEAQALTAQVADLQRENAQAQQQVRYPAWHKMMQCSVDRTTYIYMYVYMHVCMSVGDACHMATCKAVNHFDCVQ